MQTRRNILRGLGVAMATPWLESRVSGATGIERLAAPPLRLACLFMPNGVRPEAWTPEGDGEDYAITPHLKPLEGLPKSKRRENVWPFEALNGFGGMEL